MLIRLIITTVCIALSCSIQAQARLCVDVIGARPFKGPVMLGITSETPKKILKVQLIQVDGGPLRHCFDSLPNQKVELYVFQDENANFTMDRAKGRVPAEPCSVTIIDLSKGNYSTNVVLSRMIPKAEDIQFNQSSNSTIDENTTPTDNTKKNSRKRRKDE